MLSSIMTRKTKLWRKRKFGGEGYLLKYNKWVRILETQAFHGMSCLLKTFSAVQGDKLVTFGNEGTPSSSKDATDFGQEMTDVKGEEMRFLHRHHELSSHSTQL